MFTRKNDFPEFVQVLGNTQRTTSLKSLFIAAGVAIAAGSMGYSSFSDDVAQKTPSEKKIESADDCIRMEFSKMIQQNPGFSLPQRDQAMDEKVLACVNGYGLPNENTQRDEAMQGVARYIRPYTP